MGGNHILHRGAPILRLCRCQLFILLWCDALSQTGIDLRAHIALDDIPHLGLASTAVTLHRQLIVGMHLYGQVLTGVDELHKQGELITELLVDLLAHQQFLVLINQLYQCQTLIHR